MNEKLKRGLVYAAVIFFTGYLTMVFVIKGKQVMIPEVKGLSFDNARQACSSKGLYIEERSRVYDENLPEGSVISQDPLPGEYVKKGRRVFVTVSSGLKMINVPDLKDQNLRQAGILLFQSGLKVTNSPAEVYSLDATEGSILAQNPPPNLPVKRNTVVNVLVSKGEMEVTYVMPNLAGLPAARVKKALYAARLLTGKISYSPAEGFDKDAVIKQLPLPGEKIKKGDLVTLVINGKEEESRYRQVTVRFTVPKGGLLEKRMKITVMDNDGARDIYNDIVKSGTQVEKPVRLNGEAVVRIFINNELNREEKYD